MDAGRHQLGLEALKSIPACCGWSTVVDDASRLVEAYATVLRAQLSDVSRTKLERVRKQALCLIKILSALDQREVAAFTKWWAPRRDPMDPIVVDIIKRELALVPPSVPNPSDMVQKAFAEAVSFQQSPDKAEALITNTVANLTWLWATCFFLQPRPHPSNRPRLNNAYQLLMYMIISTWIHGTGRKPEGQEFFRFASIIASVARERAGEKPQKREGFRAELKRWRRVTRAMGPLPEF